jgi:hypothetical protein
MTSAGRSSARERKLSLRTSVQIDEAHCGAICDEVGYRLRRHLEVGASPVPARITALLNRLRELDMDETPSLVPGPRAFAGPGVIGVGA